MKLRSSAKQLSDEALVRSRNPKKRTASHAGLDIRRTKKSKFASDQPSNSTPTGRYATRSSTKACTDDYHKDSQETKKPRREVTSMSQGAPVQRKSERLKRKREADPEHQSEARDHEEVHRDAKRRKETSPKEIQRKTGDTQVSKVNMSEPSTTKIKTRSPRQDQRFKQLRQGGTVENSGGSRTAKTVQEDLGDEPRISQAPDVSNPEKAAVLPPQQPVAREDELDITEPEDDQEPGVLPRSDHPSVQAATLPRLPAPLRAASTSDFWPPGRLAPKRSHPRARGSTLPTTT